MFITEKQSKLDSAALVFNAIMIRKNFTPFLPLSFSVLFHKKRHSMRLDTEITLEIPLKECYISDEELLEVLRMTIHINELLVNESFRQRVLEICDEKHCVGKKLING